MTTSETLSMESTPEAHPRPYPAYIAALLAFLLSVGIAWLFLGGALSVAYPGDEAYRPLAIARALRLEGYFGAGGERLPAHEHAGWVLMLALASHTGLSWPALPWVLGLVFGLLGGAMLVSLVWRLGRRLDWAIWCGVGWGLATMTVPDAAAGLPMSVAAALVLFGVLIHLKSIDSSGEALPLRSAFWFAMAALFRVELLAAWLALALHALAVEILFREERHPLVLAVRFINGLLLAAVFFAPLIWWNRLTLQVPWPPAPDATMTLDAAAAGDSVGRAARSAFSAALQPAFGGPLWANLFGGLFALAGGVLLILDAVRGKLDGRATVFLAPIFAPLALSFLQPFLGQGGSTFVERALHLWWLPAAGYAVVRAVDGVSNLAATKTPMPPATVRLTALCLLGAIPLLAGLRTPLAALRSYGREFRMESARRAAVVDRLGPADSLEGGIATDRAGWMLYQGYRGVLDLTARLHPILLNWLSAEGVRDAREFSGYLEERGVRRAVLFRTPADRYKVFRACEFLGEDGPYLCQFTPRGGL